MNERSVLPVLLRHDRLVVIGGLVTVIAASWIYILLVAGMSMTAVEMTRMTGSFGSGADARAAMMQPATWTLSYAVFMFLMWWVMMMAMMLPSASPMILLFAAVNRKQRADGSPA